jgi:arsenical pump membrane protein
MSGYAIIGTLIFLATIAVIMARPYRVPEAATALCGAALMLLGGYVRPGEAAAVLLAEWNVYGFFLGLMAITALVDQAGILEMLAYRAACWAGGSTVRLYAAVFGAGTLITVFLSNDAAALVLTPVVYDLAVRLRLPVLPFMFACTFIADTASFIFPVGNPINVLVLDAFGGGLIVFFRYLLLPGLLCIGLNMATFMFLFRRDLRLRFDPAVLTEAKPRHPQFFRFAAAGLVVIAAAYFGATALQFPISIVALGGAGLLLAGAAWHRSLDGRRLVEEISWSLLAFITGMFIVVRAVENLGLTAAFGRWLLQLAGGSALLSVIVTAAGTALGANLINNVPMAMVMIAVLRTPRPPPCRALVYAVILGADLGPNLTTVGSLATVVWLFIVRRKGLEISTREYFKLGMTVVPVMIVLGSVLIWLRL